LGLDKASYRATADLSLSGRIMDSTTARRNLTPTVVGLAIALFALPVFMAMYRATTGDNHSNLQVLGREFAIFLLVGLLIWIVRRWERLPLTSIGLRFDKLRTSLLRGLWLAAIVLAVTVGLYLLLRGVGIHLGEDHGTVFRPSLLVVTVSMLRAGVAEEIFYRGFAIERLQSATGSKLFAGLVSLTIFAASHYRQGVGGIVAAFVLGGILTVAYMKFRDLLANITAHFLGDFVLNVILPLVSGG
jgi:membrane protease YdiL (CAAX protease family)